MPFEKQSTAIKGGKRPGAGRKAGVPNKRTAEVQQAVEASGITPLDYMLGLLRTESDHEDPKIQMAREALRFEAAKAAAPYVHAKLANVTVSGDTDNPLNVITRIERILVRPAN